MTDGIPAATSSSVRFSTKTNILNSNESLDHNNTNKSDTDDRKSMKLFIGTANLGNAAPDEASWNAWIPADGYYCTSTKANGGENGDDQFVHCKYPLRRIIYSNNNTNSTNNDNDTSSTSGSKNHTKVNIESNESHHCMDTIPPLENGGSISSSNNNDDMYQQYDILIFGMQEATFDPPSKMNLTMGKDVATTTQPPGENGAMDQNSSDHTIHLETQHNAATIHSNPDPNHTNDSSHNKQLSSPPAPSNVVKSPKKKTVQHTLSNTTSKAVHSTTKAVQKLHRTTEKTIHKVQTLSTSRDHCKVSHSPASTATPKSKRLSFPSVSSTSSLFFGSNRRNHHHDEAASPTPLLDVILDDESQNQQHPSEPPLGERPLLDVPTTIPNHTIHPTSPTSTVWMGGTTLLLQLYLKRLPSYIPIVNYQRGEMRLIIYIHKKHASDIQVKYVTAQNTGRAGLANKGGIVTELICYQHTRLSFLTAHLEAHEGYTKYMARVQSIADIFNGTTRYNNNTTTTTTATTNATNNQAPSSSLSSFCIHDCSITSHYSFVMGDLNFRTEMLEEQKMAMSIHNEEEYKQVIHQLIAEKQYDTLNDMDELHRGLYNKDCLVGYETLLCNFPPTFKVERQSGYHYIDKRRPSYTDRILYKSNLSNRNTNTTIPATATIQPLLYEPIDQFQSSDHKPVRAAFTIQLNEPYMLRPKLTKRRSTLKLANLIHTKRKNRKKDYSASLELGQKERFHLFVTNMKCDVHDPNSKNNQQKVGSSSSLALVTSTLQEIYTGTPNPYICIISDPIDLLHHQVDKGWNIFWNNAIKRTIQMKSSPQSHKRNKAHNHTCFLNTYGFPRSSIQRQRFVAEWDHNEEIHTEIRTHHADGSPIDLTGAMLRISVMDHRHSRSVIHKTTSAVTGVVTDYVIGTVTIHLVDLMRKCRTPTAQQHKGSSSPSMKMEGGIEVQMACNDHTSAQTKLTTPELTEIVDNVKYSATLTNVDSNNTKDEDDDDDPIVRVDIDEPIIKNGIETGRLQCQLEIWWTDGTITKAFTPSDSTSSGSNAGASRLGRRINNRSKISTSSRSDIAASNFQRRPPLVPDRRTAVATAN